MGGVSSAAEAVRRLPGPPLEDPPTSPPHPQDGGLLGGARWDDRRMRCQLMEGGAASHRTCQPGWRGGCNEGDSTLTSSGVSAADVPSSAATGVAVERLRALVDLVFRYQRPGNGHGGCPGWRSGRHERSAATCKPVSSPSGPRSRAAGRKPGPRSPGTGSGRCCHVSRQRRPG
jgi:hypothetical protein